MEADWGVEPGGGGEVLRIDARPAVLVAQLPGEGSSYVTSQSRSGDRVHQALPATMQTCSYRVNDALTVDADRTSSFVVVTHGEGEYLVVAFNEGIVVRPHHDGGRAVPLAPHEAALAGRERLAGVRVLPATGADPRERDLVAGLLDRVVEAMVGAPGVAERPASNGAASAAPDAVAEAADEEPPPFGRYLAEMLLTGVTIALVLAVILLVMG